MSDTTRDHADAVKAISRHQGLSQLKGKGAVGLEIDIYRYEGTVGRLANKYNVSHSLNDIISQNGRPLLEAITLS